jgi:DMSO/TMAO reductase YedYZ molybdopterin-dependent catalytic subunit
LLTAGSDAGRHHDRRRHRRYVYEGEDIEPIHGGPVRIVVPHLHF